MIKLFNDVMGTIDSCPYVPRGKCIDPVTGAALISGGASLLGDILGFGSSQSANQMNLEIAKMNNEHQYKMFQEQMAYNTDMWNKQNEYNLPSNVAQRLKDAGINPSAVFGSGSATPAGELTAPNLPALQQAHVSPYSFDLTGVGQAVNSYFQNQLVNAEKKRTQAETAHTEFLTMEGNKKLLPTLEFLENQAKKEGVLGDIARSQLRYAQDSYFWNLKQLRNEVRAQDDQTRFMAEKTYEQRLQNGLMEVQLAYAPRMSEANLRQYYLTNKQIMASTGLILANQTLTRQEALHEAEKRIGTIIDNGMKGLDFKLKEETKRYTIGLVREQLYREEDERLMRPFVYSHEMTGNAGKWLPHAAGSWAADRLYERNNSRDRLK